MINFRVGLQTRVRRSIGTFIANGLCYKTNEFKGALRPHIFGPSTLIWKQGAIPAPPWNGWSSANEDALIPGVADPRHNVFVVLNPIFLSIFKTKQEAIDCSRPAAIIPTSHLFDVRLSRNHGYLTAQHNLRQKHASFASWCVETIVSPPKEQMKSPQTKINNTSGLSDDEVIYTSKFRMGKESIPFCFWTEDMQHRWFSALRSLLHPRNYNNLHLNAVATKILLRPE